MSCPFCDIHSLKDRVFYENDKWFVFLAAPFHTKAHTIIAERPCCGVCPRVDRRGWGDLYGMGASLGEVATALMKYYSPKDILFSSVRGDIAHFHLHLIPLWAKEEDLWRKDKGEKYNKGHLLEFVGSLEKQGDQCAEEDRKNRGIGKEEQRREIGEKLKNEVKGLREVTGYLNA